ICDSNGDGLRDDVDPDGVAPWTGLPPEFYDKCPDTGAGDAPRKLVWVDATQKAPVYFLQLFGVTSVPLRTFSIAEAATVDVVIVIDTSESMGSDTVCDPNCTIGYTNPDDFDPSACNAANSCYPLRDAKDAAKALVNTLYDGYDRVAIVNFDYFATAHPITNSITGDPENLSLNLGNDNALPDGDAYSAIDSIALHDDAPAARLWWRAGQNAILGKFNPVNPEDRDGDGFDADPALPCTMDPDAYGWADDGIPGNYTPTTPCDDDDHLDAYDWNLDGVYTAADEAGIQDYINTHGHPASPVSTCTGCGMRTASAILRQFGRPDSVWVIVFLSDGVANLSDTPATSSTIPDVFPNGFCGGNLDSSFWSTVCIDTAPSNPRYCVDTDSTTCPPGSSWVSTSPPYSVEDYARDMTDEAALLKSGNPNEPLGNDIAIYSIALGQAAGSSFGSAMLRYMAAVGDDNDRTTDPCAGLPATQNCGQYYYAPSGPALIPIFEDIASRIFTRITQ
ncbi:MAG: VWA domain-containing protein, partial [Chloroflexi bacterium]|nr:VWA domain-containing protein [Chloroflexota bacterium]